ncbi:MAG: hypothetical protein ACLU5G_13160, partial [Blautia sp.]
QSGSPAWHFCPDSPNRKAEFGKQTDFRAERHTMAAVSENRMKWQRKPKWQDFYRLPVLPLRHLN